MEELVGVFAIGPFIRSACPFGSLITQLPYMTKDQRDDHMLRAQVAQVATSMLLNEESIPTLKEVRDRLGGGNLARIEVHLSAWVKRAAHIFRQAGEDLSLNLEKDELTEALYQVRELKEGAKGFAAAMAKVFWEDLVELRQQIQDFKKEAVQLVRATTKLLEEHPDFKKVLAELRTETDALNEVLDQVAKSRAAGEFITPQAVDVAIQGTGEEKKTLQAILLHLQADRARISQEWNDVRDLTDLVQKGHKALKVRLRAYVAASAELGKHETGASTPKGRQTSALETLSRKVPRSSKPAKP